MPLAAIAEPTVIGRPRFEDLRFGKAGRGCVELLGFFVISGMIVTSEIGLSARTSKNNKKKRAKSWDACGDDDIVDFVAAVTHVNEFTMIVNMAL